MFESETASVHIAGRLAAAWCSLMHDSAMWPAHGQYRCRSCGRLYPVPWPERGGMARAHGADTPNIGARRLESFGWFAASPEKPLPRAEDRDVEIRVTYGSTSRLTGAVESPLMEWRPEPAAESPVLAMEER